MSCAPWSVPTSGHPRKFTPACALLAALGCSVAAFAQPQPALTHHVPEVVQRGLAKSVEHLHADQTLRLILTLPLRKQTELDNFIQAVADPSSPTYRQYLTVEEFTDKFGPNQEDYNSVINFVNANGFTVVGTSRNRLNVDVEGTVSRIERTFNLRMNSYQHPTENRTFYAPDREPTADLAVRIWHVSGLDNYSIPHPALSKRPTDQSSLASNATTGSGLSASFLGSDMRAAYYGATALTGSGQSLGLLEFYGTNLADLNTYFKNSGQTNNVPISLVSTDGTSTSCLHSSGCDDTEQTLDMTQALGMAPGLSSLVVYVGSSDSSILNAMATANPLNAQLSISWAWSPADPATDDPYFMELAAQGQSVFVAAGDSGAWSSSTQYVFPADDPYVTSVGGTDLQTSSAGGPWRSESAWVDGGGGISPDFFAIPSWQTTASVGCALCSTAYRNGPDVAANANWTFYVCSNQTICTANHWGGTSFAAPMWAGYLALANQQAVAHGNKTLGFINPALYELASGSGYSADFHDITTGSNGDAAATGYDLATGLGSPNGSALINGLTLVPNFALFPGATSVSVALGNSGSTSITTAAFAGFNAAIALSTGSQPSGITVTLSSTSIAAPGNGSSTMTVAVASTVAPGTYPITVTGTGGGITQSVTVSLVVPAPPSFLLGTSPSSITISQGTSGTTTITIVPQNGFKGNVSLSAANLPGGVTASFAPNPTAGTSVLTLAASATTSIGNAMITITGVSGAVAATTTIDIGIVAGPLQFIPVTPCRIADTRSGTGAFGAPELAAGSTRTFNIPQSACGIPSTAVAYSLNVTVVPNGSLGYLTIWPAGQAQPNVSTLNSDGRIKANATITPAGANGGVSVYVTDATQLILDIDGYFVPAGTNSGLEFFPLTPCRIADTRNAAGPLGGPSLTGGTSRDFPVQSSTTCGIPPTAQAYSLNVTTVPQGYLGWLTAWPSGQTQPTVSTLNASTGAITANAAIVPAGSSGDVSIFVSNSADVILDINGYFAPPTTGGLSLYTVTPCRVLDTRSSSGAFNGTLAVPVHGSSCAPPATAQAYVLNATVVPPGVMRYLTLWPNGGTQPNVSTLNSYDGAITSNMAIVPTTNGTIDAFSSESTQLIFDLSGYFAP